MERHFYDRNAPQGSKSLSNLRNAMRGVFQGDLMHLEPRASLLVEDFEYPTDASIQAVWSGTGCTVTAEATKVEKGNFAGNVAIDGTGNRTVSKTQSISMDIFNSLTLWEQVNVSASAFQFYLKDSSANESYWDITSDGTQDTWQQDTLDLTTPDSDNGTEAVLTDITEYGFLGLDASKTYIFDDIKLIAGMGIIVETSNPGSYYKNVYIGSEPLEIDAKASPVISAPSGNPRIDILVVDEAGVLTWVGGSEAATPVPDWSSVATTKMPIALAYLKTTMVKMVDFEDAVANPNEGYIYADVRSLYRMAVTNLADMSDVNDGGIADGQALVWDSGSGLYIPGDVIPSGVIVAWSGLLSAIPSGWSLTDGNGGRPNFLDKFLLSVPDALTDPGDTGGAHTVTLITANLPVHTHSSGTAGSHAHTFSETSSTNNATHTHTYLEPGANVLVTGGSTNAALARSSKNTGNASRTHTHAVSGTTSAAGSHSHSIGNAGSGTAVNIDPPYYKVAWIIKD